MSQIQKSDNFHQIIILGCGPSSLSAAVQLIRVEIPILMIADEIGGLVQNANLIENLVGFPDGVTGKKFVEMMKETIRKFQIPLIQEKVLYVERKIPVFRIQTQHQLFTSEYLIIGTGTTPNHLNIPGEQRAFQNRLLFYDLYAFTPPKKPMTIGIIGNGDAAYDYALNLANYNYKIVILQRGKLTKALPLLVRRVSENSNITVIPDIKVQELKDTSNSVKILMETPTGMDTKQFDRIFVVIGRSPNLSFLASELLQLYLSNDKLDSNSQIERKITADQEKIWFIGDAKNKNIRQIAVAMGDGIKVAMQISNIIRTKK